MNNNTSVLEFLDQVEKNGIAHASLTPLQLINTSTIKSPPKSKTNKPNENSNSRVVNNYSLIHQSQSQSQFHSNHDQTLPVMDLSNSSNAFTNNINNNNNSTNNNNAVTTANSNNISRFERLEEEKRLLESKVSTF